MALSAAIVWECRASGASDSNGGGFVAGAAGTDRSQQNAAQVVINNSTITTSITANVITFTGATYTPTSADVGNIVQMLTGTNVTAGFYQITAQTSTTWTVTGAVSLPTSGTTTNATGNMGGALATISKLAGAMVASNWAFCKGAFTTTASNVFSQAVTTPTAATPPTRIIGYGTTRGDGLHPSMTLATNTGLSAFNLNAAGLWIENWDVDCANLATSNGIVTQGNYCAVKSCMVKNFTNAGISLAATFPVAQDCEVTAGSAAATAAISGGSATLGAVLRCFVHDNTCPGVILGADAPCQNNLIVNNSGASSDGLRIAQACVVENNTIHNNGRHGISQTTAQMNPLNIRNNILSNNGGFGIVGATSAIPALPDFDGNAFFSNTSGNRSNMDLTTGIFGVVPYTNVNDVVLTVSPYVGPTTGTTANFGLNNTAGGGAAVRATGVPMTWPGNSGTHSYRDFGAAQHQDTGGSLLVNPDMCGGMHG